MLKNNTGENYPVIDRIDKDGVVTSVKSRDLNCKTYQNGKSLERTIKMDVDKLKDFEMVDWGGSQLSGVEITGRQLQIVVNNKTLSEPQIQAINNAIKYAEKNGVKIIITVGR